MAVDPSTGSVSLRAEFPNPRNILLPGQFVRAQVDIGSLREGILIPQIAVKMADSGASVFVVDKKGHAVPRSIRLGEMQRSEEHTSELQSLMRISYAVFC